jgi:hypothetical protein
MKEPLPINVIIAIAIVMIVCVAYRRSHRIIRSNIKQIIFATLRTDTYTTTAALQTTLVKYDIRITDRHLRIILWLLAARGEIKRSPHGWGSPDLRSSVAYKLPIP